MQYLFCRNPRCWLVLGLSGLLALAACGGGDPPCETGALNCACYGNGTCNSGLACSSGQCRPDGDGGIPPDLMNATLEVHPSDRVSISPGGELQVRAVVRSQAGNVLMNTTGQPIVVRWSIGDTSLATVEEDGVLRALAGGSTSLVATLEGTTTTVSLPLEIASSGAQAILLDPAAAAIDVGGERTFDVSAVDSTGAPTGLSCSPALAYRGTIITASATTTPGDESIDVRGLAQGATVLDLHCGGVDATPAIIEVKPAVRIPNPSPSADADFGLEPSLVVDLPRIHVASLDQTNRKLVYTTFDGVWQTETLDGDGEYGGSSAIVLDPLASRRPIVCANENGGLACWALADDGFWTRQRIAGASSAQPTGLRAVVNDDGVVFLLYRSPASRTLSLVVSRSAQRDDWSVTNLVADFDSDFDMVLGPDGLPRVGLQRGSSLLYGSLADDLVLSTEVVDAELAAASSVRLSIGADNRPQLVYFKNGNLLHAIRSAGEWRTAVVETVDALPGSLTLGVDRHGQPRVAYVDARDQMLRYAYRLRSRRIGAANRWRIETPEAAGVDSAHSELVVDAYDRAHIAYYHSRSVDYYVEPYGLDYSDPSPAGGEEPSNTVVSGGPPGPTGLDVTGGAGGVLAARWDALSGATGYRLYYRLGAPPTRADTFHESTAPGLDLTDPLPAGRTYFAVSAIVGGQETALSAPVSYTVLLELIASRVLTPLSDVAIGFDGVSMLLGGASGMQGILRINPTTGSVGPLQATPEVPALFVTGSVYTYAFFQRLSGLAYSLPGAETWMTGPFGPGGPTSSVAVMGVTEGSTLHVWFLTGTHPCGSATCPTVRRYECTPDAFFASCVDQGDSGDGLDELVAAGAWWVGDWRPADGVLMQAVRVSAGVIDGWAYLSSVVSGGGMIRLVRCNLASGAYETLALPDPGLSSSGRGEMDMLIHGGRVHVRAQRGLWSYDPSDGSSTFDTRVSGPSFEGCRAHGGSAYCLTRANDLYRVATEAL